MASKNRQYTTENQHVKAVSQSTAPHKVLAVQSRPFFKRTFTFETRFFRGAKNGGFLKFARFAIFCLQTLQTS